MYKYHGCLIYQSHDDDGLIEVVECDGVRSLHFGTSARQSSLRLDQPHHLELRYVQAMTSGLLFKPNLQGQSLLIGLGAGSLCKFLLDSFDDCQLEVVEYRQSVVKIARSHFQLPYRDPRLHIHIEDGAIFCRRHHEAKQQCYGLIAVDAFDAQGLAPSLHNHQFFEHCYQLLAKHGVFVINLWGGLSNPVFVEVSAWIAKIFAWHTLFLPVQARSNIIVLAFKEKPFMSSHQLKQHARDLSQRCHLDFLALYHDLRRHNPSAFKYLVRNS